MESDVPGAQSPATQCDELLCLKETALAAAGVTSVGTEKLLRSYADDPTETVMCGNEKHLTMDAFEKPTERICWSTEFAM